MNFVDRFGRIHDKPVTLLDPLPCNNSWVYTAYWSKMGGKPLLDVNALKRCIANKKRHPVDYKITQQMSRDEFLGMGYLAKICGIYFPIVNEFAPMDVKLPEKNIFKTIASFVLAIGEHRNYLHEHKLYHAYRLMFMVPLQDRAYYYRLAGIKAPFMYRAIEEVDKRLKPGNNSSRLIRFLKYDIDPGLECFIEYFGKDHPITKAYRERK